MQTIKSFCKEHKMHGYIIRQIEDRIVIVPPKIIEGEFIKL